MGGRRYVALETVVPACVALLGFAAVVLPGDGLTAARFATGAAVYLLTVGGLYFAIRNRVGSRR
ncbi:hypothetical protein [Streptomyces sp. NPDC088707]|uniref:hypothetical protein n=1 Tax=Streptomyces sp. NPDC088707 TaxID=3365871 RepID=UPI003829D69B